MELLDEKSSKLKILYYCPFIWFNWFISFVSCTGIRCHISPGLCMLAFDPEPVEIGLYLSPPANTYSVQDSREQAKFVLTSRIKQVFAMGFVVHNPPQLQCPALIIYVVSYLDTFT
jgi:hypothetical protein